MTSINLIILMSLSVVGLILSEAKKSTFGRWFCKTLAALSFVVLDWYFYSKTGSDYGLTIFIAAIFCFLGDLLLIPNSEKTFIAGVFAFLVGHIGFTCAFFQTNASFHFLSAAVGLILVIISTIIIFPRIRPGLSPGLRLPIMFYIAVISTMVVCAFSVYPDTKNYLIPLAATTFYFSDMSLSLFKFKSQKPWLGILCYILYFGSQAIFAWSILEI